MCGIVGAIAERNVVPILMEGLRRLEYRGYDSAGLAVLTDGHLQRQRRMGKVAELQSALDAEPLKSTIGIAHTRWATHGGVTDANAHPHISSDQKIATSSSSAWWVATTKGPRASGESTSARAEPGSTRASVAVSRRRTDWVSVHHW